MGSRILFGVMIVSIIFCLEFYHFLTLIILQNIQHAYYFITWEKSGPSKRVVSWSSLDWDRGRWNQIDLVLGTTFDMLIHVMNSVLLLQHFSSVEALVVTLVLDFFFLAIVLYNPKLAWANPTQIPAWVQKRIRPLSADERQEIKTIENLGNKLVHNFSGSSSET